MFLSANTREKSRSFDEIISLLDGAGMTSTSGAVINSDTAMRQATVWACVRILSEIIAQLPVEVQRKESGRWVTAHEHDTLGIIAEPNEWMSQHDLISHLVYWSELVGNGFMFKNQNARGKVLRLIPMQGDSVSVKQNDDWSLSYDASHANGISGEFEAKQIFHLRNLSANGVLGLSTIGCHREGIGLALKLQEHGSRQFKNGLSATKWVESAQGLGKEEVETLRAALKSYEGAENSGKTMVLQGGLKIHSLDGITAADAQYIETAKLQKQELASIYGVPLFLLNDTANTTWGTGLEQISRSFVRFSMNPRLNRLSQTFNRELIPRNERMTTRFVFDTDGFTLGDFKERMEGYRGGIESGVLNPNECRELEGRNPRDGGEEYRQPMNINTEGQQDEDETHNTPAED